jgi:hypothetical protein
MELRDISVAECIPRFAYFTFGLLGYLPIPLCVPVLIRHDIRSIFLIAASPAAFFIRNL